MREEITAHRLEALALDFDAQAIRHLVDADLAAEDEGAVPFVGDGFGFDVVFVPDLADDLLEQVLHRDEARGAAVLIDDDRHVSLLPLQLLQQLGRALALRHEVRRPHQRGQRRLGARRQRHEIFHEHDAENVVEVLAVDRHPGVLLLAE